MVHLTIVDRSGVEKAVDVEPGLSVMEAIRDHGFDELQAQCGGACSCATCHVYVAEAYRGVLPPATEDEDDLLESSDHRQPGSRLSCQLILDPALDGLRVTIAPED